MVPDNAKAGMGYECIPFYGVGKLGKLFHMKIGSRSLIDHTVKGLLYQDRYTIFIELVKKS